MATFFVVGLCVGAPTNARAVGDEEIQMTITYSGDTMYSYVCRSGEPCFFGCKNGATDCGTTDIFSKPGYKVVAWTVESLCDASTNPVAGNFAPVEEISAAITACDGLSFEVIAYPQYQETTYTAVFDCGDGMGTPPSNIENIQYGSSVDLPESTCYKTGLNFVGWAVEGTNDIVSDDFVWQYYKAPSTKLTAQYADEINRALVTFDLNGATSGRAPAISYNKCSNLSCYLPVPGDTGYDFKRNGYAFLGWLIEGESEIRNITNGNMDLSDIVTSTNDYITATAVWEPLCNTIIISGGDSPEFRLYKITDDVKTYADANCTPGNEVTDLRDIDMETPIKNNAVFVGTYNGTGRNYLTTGYPCIGAQGEIEEQEECNVYGNVRWYNRFECKVTKEVTAGSCPPVSIITYSCGSGNGMPPAKQQVLQGDTVTILNNLTCQHAGMEFVGWLLDGELVEPGAEIVWDYDTNKTLTPKWEEKFMKMTITYNAGMNVTGVSGVNNAKQVCTTTDEGYCILGCIDDETCSDGKSNVFSRVGYNLTGWTLNDNCSGNVFDEVKTPALEDITGAVKACSESDNFSVIATAQWQPISYEVTFDCGGGSGIAPANQTIAYDETFNLPENTCTNGDMIFGGWKVSGTNDIKTASFTWDYTDNKTLVAQWVTDMSSASVVFNLNGGSGTAPKLTPNECTSLSCVLPKSGDLGYEFSRNGYEFVGWSLNDAIIFNDNLQLAGTDIGSGITNDVAIAATAVWEPECNLIRITNTAGGSDDAVIEVYKKTGETATYSDKTCTTVVTNLTDVSAVPTKANATFAGVYNGSAHYPLTTGYKCIAEDGKFSTEAECNVSGTTQWYSRFNCKAGYTYAGTVIREACEVDQNKMWISYSYGDYTVTNVSPVHDTTVQLCTGTETCVLGCMENKDCTVQDIYTRPGYTLTNWLLNDDCGGLGEVIGVDTTMNSIEDLTGAANACDWGNFTITAQAQWQPISYEVTFDCGGGSGIAPANQTIAYDETFNLPENTCTNGDMIFGGWKVSGTNDIKTASFTWDYTDNKTLVAQWVTDMSSASVVFNLNGGSGTAPKLTPNECTSLSCVLPKSGDLGYEFSRNGYEFVGWSLNDAIIFNDNLQLAGTDIGSGITNDVAIAATAVWEPLCNTIVISGGDSPEFRLYKITDDVKTYADANCTPGNEVTDLRDIDMETPIKNNAVFVGTYNGTGRNYLTTGYPCIGAQGEIEEQEECNVYGNVRWYNRFECKVTKEVTAGSCPPVSIITYSCGSGNGMPPAKQQVLQGDTVTILNNLTCQHAGMEFVGWLLDGELVDPGAEIVWDYDTNKTLTAKWEERFMKMTITYNAGMNVTGVTGTNNTQQVCTTTDEGYCILGCIDDETCSDGKSNVFSRVGYDLTGWTLNDNCSGNVFYEVEAPVLEDLTGAVKACSESDNFSVLAVAEWTAKTYNLNYTCGDGTGTATGASTIAYDAEFNLPNGSGCTGLAGSPILAGWRITNNGEILTSPIVWKYSNYDSYTLEAIWASDEVGTTVVFNLDGGTGNVPSYTSNVCSNVLCKLPKEGYPSGYTLSRRGYTFAGWNVYDGENLKDTFYSVDGDMDIAQMITENVPVTATAVWVPECNLIRITNLAGGSDDTMIEVYKKTGETATYSDKTCTTVVTNLTDVSAVPTKANATFAGAYNGSARYPLTTGYKCIAEGGKFSTEDECNVSGTTQWYSRFACNTGWTGSGTIISGECTPFVYTVTYKCGDATGTPPAEMTVADGTKFSPANFTGCTKPGYEFTHWLSTQKGEDVQYYYGSSYDLTSDVVLVAQWAPERIRIALDANGGTGGDTSVEATYGQDMPDIEVPTREGYVLMGFYEDEEDPENDIMPYYYSNGKSARRLDTSMQTLYAVWRPESYQVMYSCGEGTGTVPSNQWATYDNTFTPADNTGCTNGNLTFAGWWVSDTKDDATVDSANPFVWTYLENKLLTARWVEGEYSVNISYQPGEGASGTAPTSPITCKNTESCELPLPTGYSRPGYEFSFWEYNGSLYGAGENINQMIGAALDGKMLTFTAQWVPATYGLTYSCGTGATGMAPSKQNVVYGSNFVPHGNITCAKNAYVFDGWLLSDGTELKPGDTYTWDYQSNQTVTPKWKEKFMKMTITYNAGMNVTGVTGTNNTQQVCTTTDEGYCILGCIDGATCSDGQSNVFSRVGYDLTGWTLNDNCSGIVFYEVSMPAIEDLTGAAKACTESDYFSVLAVAQWQPKTYNVNFDCGAGSGIAPSKQTVTYDETFNLPENTCTAPANAPILAGWRVSGFDKILTGPITWDYTNSDTYTLIAVWADNNIGTTVVFNLNGGSGNVPMYTADICKNVACELPKEGYPSGYTLSRKGYTFAGWNVYDGINLNDVFYSVDGNMDIAQMITENVPVTATAVWVPECNLIRITNLAGGSDDTMIEVYKKTGETATYSDKTCTTVVTNLTDVSAVPTKANATFAGAYNGSARYPLTTGYKCITEDGTFSTEVECNVSGTTQWYSRFECLPEYIGEDEKVISSKACIEDKRNSQSKKLTIMYDAGWNLSDIVQLSSTTTQDCVGEEKCVLGCIGNGMCSSGSNVFSRPGYTLTGWDLETNCDNVILHHKLWSTVDDLTGYATACSEGNFSVFAKARWKPNTYNAKFYCSNLAGAVESMDNIEYDSIITMPAGTKCSKPGYVFDGWKAVDTSDIYDSEAKLKWKYTKDVVNFVAQWKQNAYQLSYDMNAGTGIIDLFPTTCMPDEPCVSVSGESIGSKMSRAGYVFAGWAESPNALTPITFPNGINKDTTVYAMWSPCETGTYKTAEMGLMDKCVACSDLSTEITQYKTSMIAATTAQACKATCPDITVVNGIAKADDMEVYYPNECTYNTGISLENNPCNIINGVCVESACRYYEELIDGKCAPCDRDYAKTYDTIGNCMVKSCIAGYHPNGDQCEPDIVSCDAPYATDAQRVWDKSTLSFGECSVIACQEGYHVEELACVMDIKDCTTDHGYGYQEWDIITQSWSECIIEKCNPGYTNDPSLTDDANWEQCGRCNNLYAENGEIAVSSYIQECEIASCMHQGELYMLSDNQCVLICIDEKDETGHRWWDGTRCQHKCNPGYLEW